MQEKIIKDDTISRQAAIDVLSLGKEILSRVLDDINVVGTDREKYSWGLGLIESNINDIEELPSAQPEPCADAVSREDVLALAKSWCLVSNGNYESVCKTVRKLPPVKPVRDCSGCRFKFLPERKEDEAG